MSRTPVTERQAEARRPVRPGRPPRKRAGEVDTRILDAARSVFLERGLSGASMDEIASVAGAGKPTIYARFPSKEAVFTAVVMRDVDAKIARFKNASPDRGSVEERLESVGATVLHWALVSDTVGMMRLAISEARRFPDLASSVHRMAQERGEEAVARLLAEVGRSHELRGLRAFAPERLPGTARLFMDLIFAPLIMRGLFGEKLEFLRAEIKPHVASRVRFFLAACLHGGVD